MGKIQEFPPAILICGIITANLDLLPELRARLESEFGAVDLTSDPFPFDFTDYYREEMGGKLWRIFWSFGNRFDPGTLASVKLRTNQIEEEYMRALSDKSAGRTVNLDPGYVTENKLVLATTKDFPHRIYLSEGIFAEITLHFRKKSCVPHDWTFPDFRSSRYHRFLLEVRGKL